MPDDNKLTFGDVASRNILRVSTYESEVKRYSSKVGIGAISYRYVRFHAMFQNIHVI